MEDEDSGIHAIAAPAAGDFTEQVAGEDFCRRFKATLSPKDMAILELRVEGYGYQEIADKPAREELRAGGDERVHEHGAVLPCAAPRRLDAAVGRTS